MKVLGIDPSFLRTGLCHYDRGLIRFERIDRPSNEPIVKDFKHLYIESKRVCSTLEGILQENFYLNVIIEYPPPTSQFSGGMYMLVTTLVELLKRLDCKVYLSRPAVGGYMFKQRPWKKSDSVKKAKPFVQGKYRICADEADAFLMVAGLVPELIEQLDPVRIPTYEII